MVKILAFFCFSIFFSVQAVHIEGQAGGRGDQRGGQGSIIDSTRSRMDSAAFDDDETTPMDAYYLGRAVAANILKSYRAYTANPALTRYLNRICSTIALNSSYPVLFNGYHVMILDTQEFNAFATPGGHIFLTKGLVEAATSEDMLAAVIAHELAHIMLQHGLKVIDNARIRSDIASATQRASDLAGSSPQARRIMLFRDSVSQAMDTMLKNGYSQMDEYEADQGAVVLLVAAGYNPASLLEILQILQRVQGTQRGGFNSTHPNPGMRIENVRSTVNNYRVQDTRPSRVPRFRNK